MEENRESRRDRIAREVLLTLIQKTPNADHWPTRYIARICYDLASAMECEREKFELALERELGQINKDTTLL